MRRLIRVLIAFPVLILPVVVYAEVAVIVHPSSSITSMTDDEVSRLFLGKSNNFPGGGQAVPLNQDEGSPVRDKFNEAVCKKNSSQYKAYWSQLVFTGKGTPPKDSGKDAAVKALVAGNSNMIGYVDSSVVDATVKVVYKIP